MTAPMPDLDKAAGVIEEVLIAESLSSKVYSEADARQIAQAISDAGFLLPEGFVAVPREAEGKAFDALLAAHQDTYPQSTEAMTRRVKTARLKIAYRAMIQAQETQG